MSDLSNLPALPYRDGFSDAAPNTEDNLLSGMVLKFRKGRWPVGRDEGDLTGAVLCAYKAQRAYQKWNAGQLVGQIVQRPGALFPESVEDAENMDDDGSPGEWQYTVVLHLRDLDDGSSYTFFTSSFGGRRAVEKLAGQINNMRFLRPDALPLVRLDVGSFRSKQYGEVPCPVFTVTQWVDAGGQPYPPFAQAPTALAPPEFKPAKKPTVERTVRDDLDDDLPF